MSRRHDLTGMTFGKLHVLEMMDHAKGGYSYCRCICKCGREHITKSVLLISGGAKSCGCVHTFLGIKKNKNYNAIWHGMKARCYNNTAANYRNYGGRGIKMCDIWLNDYWEFHKWMDSNNWRLGLQVDRVDNDGDYGPDNCRLVTSKVNNNNTRRNRVILINGISRPVTQWAEILGINPTSVFTRVNSGWDYEKAILTPFKKQNGDRKHKADKTTSGDAESKESLHNP